MSRARRLIERLSVEESRFLGQEFVAPVARNPFVHVRLAGAICRLKIATNGFSGWGIFQPESFTSAVFVRDASLAERARYLSALPVVQMILSKRTDQGWLALPAQRGGRQVQVNGEVPVQFVQDVGQFSVVRTRCDGQNFWFDALETRHDLASAVYLRTSLKQGIAPEKLERAGLTPEERAAYTLRYFENADIQRRIERDAIEDRLRTALAHAGAEYVDYAEHRDGYRVTYRVGRERHVSSVRKHDLSVQVAGICLSGDDAKFDLQSLVGVLHESSGDVLRVGAGGLDEAEYWRIHPQG